MLAVIETGGKQYLVKEGSKIIVDKIKDKNEGDEIIFDKVLLYFDGKDLKIGRPYLEDIKIKGKILKNIKKKTLIIKYKPKTRYRKKKGYKSYFSEVLITADLRG
ncbi:MAG: 50S ribosomal protein L21 [Minisyncoccia bacterium]